MEKEIYWSKDVESDNPNNNNAPKTNNGSAVQFNNPSQAAAQSSQATKQLSGALDKVLNVPANLKPRSSGALRTSSPVNPTSPNNDLQPRINKIVSQPQLLSASSSHKNLNEKQNL